MNELEELMPDPDRRDAALARINDAINGYRYKNRRRKRGGRGRIARLQRRTRDLTPRERQIALCFSHGLNNVETAEVLGVTVETIKSKTKCAKVRVGAKDRWHLVAIALRNGAIK